MKSIKRSLRTTDPAIPQFNIQDWLKDGGNLVTRRELYDFISRMEVGRRVRNRWDRRLVRLARSLWKYLSGSPLDVEDKIYR